MTNTHSVLDPPPPPARLGNPGPPYDIYRPSDKPGHRHGYPLGGEHWIEFFSDPQGGVGAVIRHAVHNRGRHPLSSPDADYLVCHGCAWLAGAAASRVGNSHKVNTVKPLSFEAALQCHCGERGYIKKGVWVPA